MIYTITFNAAVDLVIQATDCKLGELNRSTSENYVAGGKGINISVILQRLGYDNIATGFLGGFTGEYIKSELAKDNIQTNFIEVMGTTRINVKLKSQEETEINAAGPTISEEEFCQLFQYLSSRIQKDDVVFLAGNAAPGLSAKHYVAIAQMCQEQQAKLVLDTNKSLLKECLVHGPFIIKPNHHELGELFDVVISDEEEIIHYAQKLQDMGAKNILVSRGGAGALLLTEKGEVYRSNVPKGQVVNSVGAGDSMLAGFMASYITTNDYSVSLQRGAATGSATAFSVGIATKEYIEELLPQIIVEKVK
ncbi:1-phosphofructokinase [Granulicatella balaenopterae]|uniref:Tagatose-6-phosphate kinase n=1 Tax=Granulicatella balaenopterae TaxID=137733 RepID=A0A1H9LGH6_9LACT|nr:1-phosphofructokinase [Granulicatella balaenopterae]SER10602.1 1-phosphofructokinase [Granulicatella balaenopterae]